MLAGRAAVEWKWGPVTSYQLSLEGIDSCGESGNDVMELVCALQALRPTQEILLDDFMHGFVHELYLQKWKLYGRWTFWVNQAAYFFYVSLLLTVCAKLKRWGEPTEVLHAATADALAGEKAHGVPVALPLIVIFTVLAILAEDVRICRLWHQGFMAQPDVTQALKEGPIIARTLRSRSLYGALAVRTLELANEGLLAGIEYTMPTTFRPVLTWAKSRRMHSKAFGFACALVPCVLIVANDNVNTDALWLPLAMATFFALDISLQARPAARPKCALSPRPPLAPAPAKLIPPRDLTLHLHDFLQFTIFLSPPST